MYLSAGALSAGASPPKMGRITVGIFRPRLAKPGQDLLYLKSLWRTEAVTALSYGRSRDHPKRAMAQCPQDEDLLFSSQGNTSTAGLRRGEEPVPAPGESSATTGPPPEEGDRGSRQLLPGSGIFWLNRDLTKPALRSSPHPKGSGSLSAGE